MAEHRTAVSHKLLVGLEIHVQLATRTKLFTGAPNGATHFGAEPNSLVDPVILGLPGVLPVMNKRAVEYAIKVGLALGCEIARHTKWDRKSYYYPDLPKNYQISQYDEPLCGAGVFELELENGESMPIRIRRAHLEEDAGKLLHEAPGGYRIDHSIVDLNRAGTPLLEIVTEPDFSSGRQVRAFAQELQRIVQFLGVSEAQMQMGHMRFEPNINLHITDAAGKVHKTAITEIKNLNSFTALERATDYESRRQLQQWLDQGDLGRKSTYGWDDAAEVTLHQRDKEEEGDYRYFPDPDLLPVEVNEAWLNDLKAQVGELPRARRKRYTNALGLSEKDAATLTGDRATGDYFEQILAAGADAKRACTLMETLREVGIDRGMAGVTAGIAPARLAEIAALIQAGTLAGNKETVRGVMTAILERDRPAKEAADDLGLTQSTDFGEIDRLVAALFEENPKSLQDYRAGRQQARGALIGMIMKKGKGLNPKLVGERLEARMQQSAGQ